MTSRAFEKINRRHSNSGNCQFDISYTIQVSRRSTQPIKRSILFIAFTGEEEGMLGSQYNVAHPTVKLKVFLSYTSLIQ